MDWACNRGGAGGRNGDNILSEYLEGTKYWQVLGLYVLQY